ncbi:N-acetylmuramoyl-L-alanine amidase [Streptomyces sp. V4-01]|uniref:N-acetylmuramoyl-L-alanine amidase n=1 Tax=Actinacidiphila polyblastidii TaxID=3110430 RepID=A0ABU7PEM0_9ACTN|nr:N-acetylmuramoyl-L-alanine amidase [Streptomyces sp. V4-01]
MFSNESRGGGRGGAAAIAMTAVGALAAVCLAGCSATGSSAAAAPGADGANGASRTGADTRVDSGVDHDVDSGAGASRAAGSTPGATHSASSGPVTGTGTGTHPAGTPPLAGEVVVLDPGHNLGNAKHTAEIDKLVDVGNARKECDTTGTETNAGYAEASYTLDVTRRVRAILRARGAKVTLTYDGDRPYGPCVNERAWIGDKAHADAALSIHADGAPAADRGFHVIAPKSLHAGIADTRAIAGPSLLLATTLRSHFAAATKEPFANYVGGGSGLTVRSDLGGLNLSTVPKVFIECGNMRNAHDAASLTDAAWRQHAAQGIADGLTAFLEGKR